MKDKIENHICKQNRGIFRNIYFQVMQVSIYSPAQQYKLGNMMVIASHLTLPFEEFMLSKLRENMTKEILWLWNQY